MCGGRVSGAPGLALRGGACAFSRQLDVPPPALCLPLPLSWVVCRVISWSSFPSWQRCTDLSARVAFAFLGTSCKRCNAVFCLISLGMVMFGFTCVAQVDACAVVLWAAVQSVDIPHFLHTLSCWWTLVSAVSVRKKLLCPFSYRSVHGHMFPFLSGRCVGTGLLR